MKKVSKIWDQIWDAQAPTKNTCKTNRGNTMLRFSAITSLLIAIYVSKISSFSFISLKKRNAIVPLTSFRTNQRTRVQISFNDFDEQVEPNDDSDEEEEDEEGDEETDPYRDAAVSEFLDTENESSALAPVGQSDLDWGGEYGKLSERIDAVESGGEKPSGALFRVMTSETPNQAITKFMDSANPQVVKEMVGAVSSLLGGLSNPAIGMETIVRTSGDMLGNMCLQLQVTGYMFRNAEYLMALKELMNLKGGATLEDYEEAFNRLDKDKSGFIDTYEIEALLADVYDGAVPNFEIDTFLKFFDSNRDGKISWEEFKEGLGNIAENAGRKKEFFLPAVEEEDDAIPDIQTTITGTIEIELDDGQVIEVEANDYIESLKKEAENLKIALRAEMGGGKDFPLRSGSMASLPKEQIMADSIAGYIAAQRDNMQKITSSIEPEIMDTMKMLVDFVIEGGNTGKEDRLKGEQPEMEIPGAALQQLALWQLILGYKLREAEATGDYMKLLE